MAIFKGAIRLYYKGGFLSVNALCNCCRLYRWFDFVAYPKKAISYHLLMPGINGAHEKPLLGEKTDSEPLLGGLAYVGIFTTAIVSLSIDGSEII